MVNVWWLSKFCSKTIYISCLSKNEDDHHNTNNNNMYYLSSSQNFQYTSVAVVFFSWLIKKIKIFTYSPFPHHVVCLFQSLVWLCFSKRKNAKYEVDVEALDVTSISHLQAYNSWTWKCKGEVLERRILNRFRSWLRLLQPLHLQVLDAYASTSWFFLYSQCVPPSNEFTILLLVDFANELTLQHFIGLCFYSCL